MHGILINSYRCPRVGLSLPAASNNIQDSQLIEPKTSVVDTVTEWEAKTQEKLKFDEYGGQ